MAYARRRRGRCGEDTGGASSFCRLVRGEELARFDLLVALNRTRRPSDLDERDNGIGTETDDEPSVAGGKVPDRRRHRCVLRQAGCGDDLHSRADPVAIRSAAGEANPKPMSAVAAVV